MGVQAYWTFKMSITFMCIGLLYTFYLTSIYILWPKIIELRKEYVKVKKLKQRESVSFSGLWFVIALTISVVIAGLFQVTLNLHAVSIQSNDFSSTAPPLHELNANIKNVKEHEEIFDGNSVTIFGNTAAVGNYIDSSEEGGRGNVNVYWHSPTEWLEDAILTSDRIRDGYGLAVELYADTLVVSAPLSDEARTNSGAVYIYRYARGQWILEAKVVGPEPILNARFGSTISINEDTLVVAENRDGAIDGNNKVYLFRRMGTEWNLTETFHPPEDVDVQAYGVSLAVQSEYLLIGAPGNVGQSGMVVAYENTPTGWMRQEVIVSPTTGQNENFGIEIEVNGDTAAIVSNLQDDENSSSSILHIFTKEVFSSEKLWNEQTFLVPTVGDDNSQLGSLHSIALSNNTVVASAISTDDLGQPTYEILLFTNESGQWSQNAVTIAANINIPGHSKKRLAIDISDGNIIHEDYKPQHGIIDPHASASIYSALEEKTQTLATRRLFLPLLTNPRPFSSENLNRSAAATASSLMNVWGDIVHPDPDMESDGEAGHWIDMISVNGRPAIAYYDHLGSGLGNLMYVRALDAIGTLWGTPIIVDSGGQVGHHVSIEIVNGNPAISYNDKSNGHLLYVRANDVDGTNWGGPVVVDNSVITGWFTSLIVVAGNPAIAYHQATGSDLRYTRATDANGATWGAPITVDSAGTTGREVSMTLINGTPAIGYYYLSTQDLRYVKANDAIGSTWGTPVIVDATGFTGLYVTLRDVNGYPGISYFDYDNRTLRFIRATDANGITWGTSVPIEGGNAGWDANMHILPDGRVGIAFFDASPGVLLYVESSDVNGTSWNTSELIDNSATTGWYPWLTSVNGLPAIGYFQVTNPSLKYVRQVGNNPPGPVTQISPNNVSVPQPAPTFVWQPESNAMYYTLVVYDVNANNIVLIDTYPATICSATDCMVQPNNLSLTAGIYTWLIRASNTDGVGPWSSYP